MLLEIRFHGRGGQGAVTAANMLVKAAWISGLWGQGFPFFGAERRGAPVAAFARISDKPIRIHCEIRSPSIVVVLDERLLTLVDVTKGLVPGGWIIANAKRRISEVLPKSKHYKRARVDATSVALSIGLVMAGWPIVNTAMLGALLKATGIMPIKSLISACMEEWSGKMGELNAQAATRAFNETVIEGD